VSKPPSCVRCDGTAAFTVTAGDRATKWHRTESVCLACLPASKRWASFVGPVSITSHGASPAATVQATLFDLSGEVSP
jgi:hypothetical protein